MVPSEAKRRAMIEEVAESRYLLDVANAARLHEAGFDFQDIAVFLRVPETTARRYILIGVASDFPYRISDGMHTMGELYDYRMAYNALAAKFMKDCGLEAIKSRRHHDGEPCFGGGWFIVVMDLPGVGQVSNHYKDEFWDLFDAEEAEVAPEWDGHTPDVALQRMLTYLKQ